ncbi:AGR241Wp [Eremothecium gossypii ATCC 10895]|uniref:Riboflavin synthase n=1 Tax=Eremothecium gossypii (strain ATCC 10895 / CBS 109.51 / FGSC 9923 / NRRL Y-1056) TaxID=284811 RepID=Q74ZG6_EREGS|nr:AGR241Wp [Eremothecium gossypii ATCC 10895]AAS54731.1 AGR241Wp [Eremothecium gossypii ATCC 10895]AEY99062.1 FAGR241Wp [Eremothecium gossypii FDAG1]
MFTGIVEHIGTVAEYLENDASEAGGNGVSVLIKDAAPILADCHIGDSIACNGICLTVTEFTADSFKVGIAPETVYRTEVSSWKAGSKINLERAISDDRRYGGHYVQGHVDSVASIVSREHDGNSINFKFKLRDQEYEKYVVEKGFVAIDGVSLTVSKMDPDGCFYISMIAHTQTAVALPLKPDGALVNIETDVNGKLVEKQVAQYLNAQLEGESSPLQRVLERIIESKLASISNK